MNRKAIFLLISAIGVIGANSLLLSPIALSVATTLNTTGANVMWAAAAYGLGVGVSALVLAPRADRIGADRALVQAMILLAVALLISAVAPRLDVLLTAQALAGLAAGTALPAIYTLSAEIAPPGRDAQTIGAVLTGWTLSMVLGVTLSAVITDYYSWRVVYGLLGGVSLMLVLPLKSMTGISQPRPRRSGLLTALQVPGIAGGLGATALLMLAFYITYFFTGLHVEGVLGRSPTASGMIPLFYGVGFGASVIFDKTLDRVRPHVSVPAIFALIAVIYTAMAAITDHYVGLLAMSFVWGLAQHTGLNLTVARLTRLDPTQRGAVMGLYSCVTYLCVFAAPLIGGAVFAAYGFVGCLLIAALCAGLESIEARLSLRTGRSAVPPA